MGVTCLSVLVTGPSKTQVLGGNATCRQLPDLFYTTLSHEGVLFVTVRPASSPRWCCQDGGGVKAQEWSVAYLTGCLSLD